MSLWIQEKASGVKDDQNIERINMATPPTPKDILVEREKFMKETVGGLPIYSD
mgnify:CR=1 FL=1